MSGRGGVGERERERGGELSNILPSPALPLSRSSALPLSTVSDATTYSPYHQSFRAACARGGEAGQAGKFFPLRHHACARGLAAQSARAAGACGREEHFRDSAAR